MQEAQVRFLGWEDPLEKEMAIHSSTLAWKIPWIRPLSLSEPQGKQFQYSNRAESCTEVSLTKQKNLEQLYCYGYFLKSYLKQRVNKKVIHRNENQKVFFLEELFLFEFCFCYLILHIIV